MKTQNKFLIVSLIIFIAVSCSTTARFVPVPVTRVIEKERIVNKPFDVVWQSAVEWFATHNTPIKNMDKSSGLISTEYSLPLSDASRYMDCGSTKSSFSGYTNLENHSGNFNVLLKKVGDNATKININVFFGCSVNTYQSKGLLSTDYVLKSSSRINCTTTGTLEKEVLDYIEAF
ncbi:MAG: hypothetical protein COZ76_03135 [Flavobacteriales bacterium CG_4_8_14_3_um_filter_35_10]|nr:MAG: hypothetical protein COZ76_03135 [Flavobacteriales bacterium CG_4_8_14_3_um_filter_35_10]PJA04528.1 MAG: hypothetical protein COX71_11345 [Flavobacteriales bacterium CG_4_10_14_0_2_um_filter_35_18]